jgi:hydrophobic/amphiphilic exporter-1 (mainly G- bacteria), HAE1 family
MSPKTKQPSDNGVIEGIAVEGPIGEDGGNGGGRRPRAEGSGMAITRIAIERPLFMLMAILAVLVFGVIGYGRMGVDLFPAVNFPVVLVSVPYPGASPEVVENLVTKQIEDAVGGLADLDTISSFSSEGLSVVTIQFKDKADAQASAIDVEKRVNAARANLPTDILPPTVLKFDFSAQPIITLALSGERSQEQLFRLADEKIRPRLETLGGVGQVTVFGGRQREIQVKVDPSRLRAYNITLQQVTQALGAENLNVAGGQVQEPGRNFNLRVDAKFRTPQEVESTVVTSAPGGPVRVRDVATVVDGFKDQALLSRVNGKEAVGFTITKQATANVTSTAKLVRDNVAVLQTTLPEDVKLDVITDSSVFIRNSLNGVQRSLVEAVILTGLVLLVFLHSWRSTFIVVLAIPTSLIATFGTMWLQGFTLNFLSTLALALTVGILVDDSIVVLENIYRHLNKGEPPRLAAINGRSEIGMAAIAITLVDVVVFTPVALMSGQIGQFFRQFGFTVVAATLFSLVISFTLTPLLASRWLTAADEHGTGLLGAFGRRWERWFAALERRYERLLRWTLNHRWAIVLMAFLAFAGGVALPATGVVKSEFFPDQDQGQFTVFIEMPPGTNLERTAQAASQVEKKLAALPEVKTIFTSVGQGENTTQRQARYAQLFVNLHGKHERKRSAAQVANEAKGFAEGIPGAKIRPGVPSAGGGTAQPIQIRISGEDLATLAKLAEEAGNRLKELGSVTDITNSGQPGAPEYVISVDRQKAADLGLSAAQVASTVRTAYAGSVATQLRPENAVGAAAGIDVRVQLTDETRTNLDRLSAVPLISPLKGGQVLLGQVATIAPAQGPSQIQRIDRQRNITIGASLAEGKVLGDVSREVESALKKIEWPAGYTFQQGGSTQQQNDTFKEFGQALGLSILLTYMLLVALYESLFYPLVVMFALPLALVGAMAGLAITGETLNLFSLIGVIMLTGLVGKNSILVVDYTNTLRRRGMGRREALLLAGPTRMRPVLMTSAALIFAMMPLALKLEEGAEAQAPLAVVVMGGMITSTLLALVFVPVMYTLVDDFQNLLLRIFRRGRPQDASHGDTHGDMTEGEMDEIVGEEPQEVVAVAGKGKRGANGAARKKGPAVVPAGVAVTTLAVGALLFSACGPAETTQAARPAPPSVAVAEVKAETVRAIYGASGAVEATDQVAIVPKVGGRVLRLNAEVGASVRAGDLIAELDHAALDSQVQQAEAGLAVAQARLAQLERGPRSEDVAAAAGQRDAAAQQAQAAAAQATAATQGLSTLDAQVQGAQEQAQAAAAQAQAAQLRLEQVRNPRAEDVTLVQAQANLAQIRLAQAQSRDEEIRIAVSQVEAARVGLQQALDGNRPEAIRAAQAALDQAQTALANITDMPVRNEDLQIAKLAWEGADAGWRSAQNVLSDTIKAYNAAKQMSDNLPFIMTRAQADAQLAQAEAGVHNAEANLEARRVARDQARATYEKLSSGASAWDVRLAQERVEAAKAQLDLTKNPDPARVKAAQLAVEQAQAQLDAREKQITFDIQSAKEGVKTAEAQLAKLLHPGTYDLQMLEEQARAAQAQARAAQAQADALLSQRLSAEASASAAGNQAAAAGAAARQAEAGFQLRANPFTAEDLRSARASVQQAQAAYDAARTQQAEAFIQAPVDGMIATRNASVGSMVGPTGPIVTLVSDSVEVTVPVEETRVAAVRPGQTVAITAAAAPGQTFGGTVTSVAPSGDPRSRSFTARIRPDAPAGTLRPGMFVQVSIATDERENVAVVPREAVALRDGKQSVFAIGTDNKLSLRPVTLGLMSDRIAEVIEGLKIGDRVVVLGVDDLRDGQTVSPVR